MTEVPLTPKTATEQSSSEQTATAASENPGAIRKSRVKLLSLMGLYAAPLLAAWIWFGYVSNNEGAGVAVNGELIHPAVPLQAFNLQTHDTTQWGVEQLRGKWSMVFFASQECDEQCELALYNMRQIRLSTGRRMTRVQRVFVTPDWQQQYSKLEPASEGLQVVGGAQIPALQSQFDNAQANMGGCDDCIYLVDPYGNLMMRFGPDVEPKKILKDLKHLLKVSRIG